MANCVNTHIFVYFGVWQLHFLTLLGTLQYTSDFLNTTALKENTFLLCTNEFNFIAAIQTNKCIRHLLRTHVLPGGAVNHRWITVKLLSIQPQVQEKRHEWMALISVKGHIPDFMWACTNVNIINDIFIIFLVAADCQSPKLNTNLKFIDVYVD